MLIPLLAVLACAPSPSPSSPGAPEAAGVAQRNVDVVALKGELDAGRVPVLVDVRTAAEFGGGHVPGAKNIPINELDSRLAELEAYRAGEVYVICAKGGRSAEAAKQLSAKGYRAVNVTGGTSAWIAAGNATE